MGSFRYSFDFGEPEPAWRQVVASAVRLLGAVPGRAWALLRAPRGALPSPPASDGDSTRTLSVIASSGSLTAVEDEEDMIEWRRLREGMLEIDGGL